MNSLKKLVVIAYKFKRKRKHGRFQSKSFKKKRCIKQEGSLIKRYLTLNFLIKSVVERLELCT